MEKLRQSERTPQNQQGERRAFYGLMPASISHEGYSAKPMHSYWDDFWALAGYEAAVRIARALGAARTEMRAFIESRDEFRSDLYRSLQIAIAHARHRLSAGRGRARRLRCDLDHDRAVAGRRAADAAAGRVLAHVRALLARVRRARRTDTSWDAYTPYEWRNLGTFIRLGWRERGHELIDFFMDDRRPAAWNQWAEVVGREPRKPRFIGDMPHGWVASDYVRSLLDMFAYERPADETLVLMAGVPEHWTRKDGFAVRNLRTPFGPLSYSLKIDDAQRVLDLAEIRMPPGGIVIAWPEGEKLRESIDQARHRRAGSARELRVTAAAVHGRRFAR